MKKVSKTDLSKIDAMTYEDLDYSDSTESAEESLEIAFIHEPIHKKPICLFILMLAVSVPSFSFGAENPQSHILNLYSQISRH